jgi:hypothetical protein
MPKTKYTGAMTMTLSERRFFVYAEDIDCYEISLSNLYILYTFYRLFNLKFSCSWVKSDIYYSSDTILDILTEGLRCLYEQEELTVIEGYEDEELEEPFDEDFRCGIIWRPKWFKKVWKKDRKRIRKWVNQADEGNFYIISLTKENDGICFAVSWEDFFYDSASEFLLLIAKLEKRRAKYESRHRN